MFLNVKSQVEGLTKEMWEADDQHATYFCLCIDLIGNDKTKI